MQELLLSRDVMVHCRAFTFAWNELSQLAKLPLSANVLGTPEMITWQDAWFMQRIDTFQQHIQYGKLFNGW